MEGAGQRVTRGPARQRDSHLNRAHVVLGEADFPLDMRAFEAREDKRLRPPASASLQEAVAETLEGPSTRGPFANLSPASAWHPV